MLHMMKEPHIRRDIQHLKYRMENRIAMVTGSTSGIGLAIAESLASRGCSLIITGFGDEQEITKIQSDLKRKYGVSVHYIHADLSREHEITAMCKAVHDVYPDGIDILINNAGIQRRHPIEDYPMEDWNALLMVMLTAPFIFIKHFLPNMKKKGWGRIVNMSSVMGLVARPHGAAYNSAKHGIIGLTKVVALETAGAGITCNAVCPGAVDTPLATCTWIQKLATEQGISLAEAEKVFLNGQPTGQLIAPNQIAELVAFICSDVASQMTGSSVCMDGGYLAH